MANNIVEYTLKISDGGAKVELKKLSSTTEKLGKNLNTAEARYKKLQKRLKKLDKTLLKAAAGFAAFGFAVTKTLQGIKAFTMEAVDMINDLGDIGNRSGVAADTIGGLKAAFHASGQEASQVNQVLDVVAKKLGSLSRGSKAAEDAFAKYGIATRNLNGSLRTNNDILLDSMHVIQGLADTSLRSRAAVELFGVGGQRLSQALGAGDFDKFLEFVNEFGAVAGPKAAKSAALVQDSLSLSNVAFEGFREELVLAVDLMGKLQTVLNATMGFFAGLKEVLHTSGGTLSALIDTLGRFANQILSVINHIIGFGFASLETGIQGLIENFVLLGAAITRHFIKIIMTGMSAMIKFAALSDLIFDTQLTSSIFETQQAFSKLHETLDPKTNRGFLAFQSFQVGLAKSMKLFGDIVQGATHETTLANKEMQDLNETLLDTDETINTLAESAEILNGILDKLNIPKQLQIGGIARITQDIQTLAQGLSDLGMIGTFGNVQIRGQQKSLDMAAQQIALMIAKAAPKIAAIVAVVFAKFAIAKKLGQMGETPEEIKKNFRANVSAQIEAIERGLHVLPVILREVLPDLFGVLVDSLIFGFSKALAEKLGFVVDFLKGIFTREGRQQRRDERITLNERANEFMRRLGVLGDIITGDSLRSGGRFFPSARAGIKFTGAEEGLAMLHRGEFVVPETGQMPQAVQRNMAGQTGGVVLNINAAVVEQNAVDELVRMIERRFTTFGQSTSPLFGA